MNSTSYYARAPALKPIYTVRIKIKTVYPKKVMHPSAAEEEDHNSSDQLTPGQRSVRHRTDIPRESNLAVTPSTLVGPAE